jgi:HEAT repeat protein
MQHVAGLLGHPNLAIRLEALKSIGTSKDSKATGYLTKALEDQDAQVRMTAASSLAKRDRLAAKTELLPIVQNPEFRDRADREQAAFYSALAFTETQEAFDFFSQQIQATGFLGRKSLLEQKKNIITGVANTGTASAKRFLTGLIQAGIKDREVTSTAERALKRLEERLRKAKQGE